MRVSEALAVGYFAYLALTARILPVSRARRARVTAIGIAVAALVALVAWLPRSPALGVARDWIPGLYLVAGYWTTGLLYTRPRLQTEQWLARLDASLFARLRLMEFIGRAPRALLEYLELTYLCCYLLVPAGFAVLYFSGFRREADHFWTTVLLAAYGAYGVLPWVPTRPPRALEPDRAIDRRHVTLRRANLAIVKAATIQVNTFPSGHVAGAFATALAMASVRPLAGDVFGLVALSIAAATVVGRYHYALDAVLGALLAVVSRALVWAAA